MLKLKSLMFGMLMFCVSISMAQSFKDVPYLQPISKKYGLKVADSELKISKIVSDRDDNVYALTNKGVYIILEDQLVKDRRYSPLENLIPQDIVVQSGTGILYYLYDDHYLSNAHAGTIYQKLDANVYQQMAVSESGKVLLTGGKQFAMFSEDGSTVGREAEKIIDILAEGDDFYIHTEYGISKYKDGRFEQLVSSDDILSWTVGGGQLYVGSSQGIYSVDTESGKELQALTGKLPVVEVHSMTYANGELWAGTDIGMFSTTDLKEFDYYASKRWLVVDQVSDICIDNQGNAFALTGNAISEVHFKSMTLADKADYFYKKIRKRHLRLGLIGEVKFSTPGDITTTQMVDTDNDGLWTAFYLGSEVFRYATTRSPEAKKNAMESFESFERLLSINPLEGFPSRTFERKGFKVSDPDRWRDSQEEEWEWKGHTSSDEFVAYIWIAGILNKHLDLNLEEKKRVADFIDQIMTHIIDNDYYFVDADGKPTLWGRWNPEYLNWYPESVVDRKLGSITITAGLQLAYALTGDEKYKSEAFRLFEDHGYLDNIKIPLSKIASTPGYIYAGHNMGEGGWNHSDDEMAFPSYWILYHYAFNKELQDIYSDVITDHFTIEKPERNALWSTIAYGTTGDVDLPSVQWHLREFQMDMVRWTIKNSHRKDLDLLPDNFREQSTRTLLSPAERETIRHNANPFDLDGGNGGRSELAGDEYLLPYWMARYLNLIQP